MNLSERDQKHNWHPYTQHKTSQPEIAIVKGEGALLWDENNKEYIDRINKVINKELLQYFVMLYLKRTIQKKISQLQYFFKIPTLSTYF